MLRNILIVDVFASEREENQTITQNVYNLILDIYTNAPYDKYVNMISVSWENIAYASNQRYPQEICNR